MTKKLITKNAVNKEFNTIGLVLIVYSLFVLFIPTLLELTAINELEPIHGLSVLSLTKLGLLIFGSFFPFLILRIGFKKKRNDISTKVKIPFIETLYQFFTFFTFTSVALFASTTLANYFGYEGELTSSIGVSLYQDFFNDYIYVFLFVVITPILEGYVFRGVLLNVLAKYGKYFAVYVCAILYSLAHGSFLEMIPAFIMGYMLNKMSFSYKSIKPTIIIHILFNLIIYLLISVPEEYSIFMVIMLLLIYLLAIIILVFKIYHPIKLIKGNDLNNILKIFFSNKLILIASFLFIFHSILVLFL